MKSQICPFFATGLFFLLDPLTTKAWQPCLCPTPVRLYRVDQRLVSLPQNRVSTHPSPRSRWPEEIRIVVPLLELEWQISLVHPVRPVAQTPEAKGEMTR